MADQRAICKATGVQNWKWSEYAERASSYLSNNQQPRIINEAELRSAIELVKDRQNEICETADGRAKAAFVMGYVAEAESIDTKIPANEVGAKVLRDYSAFRHLVPMTVESSFNGTINRFADDVKDVTSYFFSDHRFLDEPTLEQETILQDVLNKVRSAKQSGRKPVVIFDLDDAVFDPSAREHRLLNELLDEFIKTNPGVLTADEIVRIHAIKREELSYSVDLDLQVTFGITNQAFLDAWKVKFFADFFTSKYCKDDPAYPGAPEYVRAVQGEGATIVYFTGRQEAGKPDQKTEAEMRTGTMEALRSNGFPVPNGKSVQLIMKPDFKMKDMEYKSQFVPQIKAMGALIAAFDNEPRAGKIFTEAGASVVIDIGMVQAPFYGIVEKDGVKKPVTDFIQNIPFEPETVVRIADFRRTGSSASKNVVKTSPQGGGVGATMMR